MRPVAEIGAPTHPKVRIPFASVETIETPRVVLGQWEEKHREAWRIICADPEVMRYIGPGQVWDTATADGAFDHALAHWQEHDFGWRSVLERATGVWLGFVGLNYAGPGIEGVSPDEVEIGWWIIRPAWGRGIASEGAVAIRDEGFERICLHRIISRLQPANTGSARVAQKIGLSFEREARGRSGEALHIYALDRSTWSHSFRKKH